MGDGTHGADDSSEVARRLSSMPTPKNTSGITPKIAARVGVPPTTRVRFDTTSTKAAASTRVAADASTTVPVDPPRRRKKITTETVVSNHRIASARIPRPPSGPKICSTGSSFSAAVEVRQGAGPLQRLTDRFWLSDVFGLRDDERADACAVADALFDSVCAVVCLDGAPRPASAAPQPEPICGDQSLLVYLADIATQANSRRGAVVVDSLVMATLEGGGRAPADVDALGGALGVPVTRIDSEAAAARAGALTTPGVTGDVVVVDVGGGTVDVVTDDTRMVLPGAGQLLTTATATALEISRSAAEYAKRAEALTAVTVQLVEDEHGRRRFLDKPVDGRCTGWLLTSAPSGLLPFTSRLSGAEWRSWRLAAKRMVIGGNVMRGIEKVAPDAGGVLLVGGGAGDDELVRAVSEQLGHRVAVGRGNVRGQLGHRFAVAYGLVALAAAAQ